MKTDQGVALTGRNTTGPPSHAVPCWVTLHMCGVLQTIPTHDDRHRWAKQYCPRTLC